MYFYNRNLLILAKQYKIWSGFAEFTSNKSHSVSHITCRFSINLINIFWKGILIRGTLRSILIRVLQSILIFYTQSALDLAIFLFYKLRFFQLRPNRTLKMQIFYFYRIKGVILPSFMQEWSYIPVGGSLPNTEQKNLAFGAAASMVHPATGKEIDELDNVVF